LVQFGALFCAFSLIAFAQTDNQYSYSSKSKNMHSFPSLQIKARQEELTYLQTWLAEVRGEIAVERHEAMLADNKSKGKERRVRK
jgi:hypothetical protein